MKQQKSIYQIQQLLYLFLVVSVLTFIVSCNNSLKSQNLAEKEGMEEVQLKTILDDEVKDHDPQSMESVNQAPARDSHLSLKEDVLDKEADREQDNENKNSFFFCDPTLEKSRNLEPAKAKQVTPTQESTKKIISLTDWSQVDNFCDEALSIALRQLPPQLLPNKQHADSCKAYFKSTYSNYYMLYKMIVNNNKSILNKKDFKKNFLEPLGHFVAVFESQFDMLRTYYKKNAADYLSHKDRLENHILPIVQQTFNTIMRVYEKQSSESLGMIGPLKYQSQSLSVRSEDTTKHVFFKKDITGNFLLFTLYPHKKIKDNLYYSYLPYLHVSDPNYVEVIIIFSMDQDTHAPIIEAHPGLIFEKGKAGYIVRAYRGNTTTFPFTTPRSILITHKPIEATVNVTSQKDKFISQVDREDKKANFTNPTSEPMEDPFPTSFQEATSSATEPTFASSEKSEFINQVDPEKERKTNFLNPILESLAQEFPDELKGAALFNTEPFTLPKLESIKEFIKNTLGDEEIVFIPFPYTEQEEAETTYLFLITLEQRLTEKREDLDIPLLQYIEHTAFPGKKLQQIIQEYEAELINEYTEEEIRLEQESRSRMVATGGLNQKASKPKKAPSTNKKKGKGEKRSMSMKHEVEEHEDKEKLKVNESSLEKVKEKARKRLEELRESSRKNGPVKFRKFMQLVNVASQGSKQLGLTTIAELNKSSHGRIKVGEEHAQTVVRPHGGPKEKSVSANKKKKILTSLVQSLINKLSEQ